ncbi:hypothetical protein [Puniceibacterium sp. IMCC21224]|uniref:hypothetical protein n=1 Tax=Puniceibacterium sp. IMCC21224 TaxID=1618204 RepID=UPI00065D5104|nr:hypothetical protein [Puniceibacterium sp. IMCC21224]KMK68884.1 hypothetical protein IMCC21224_113770 [Puniceibacterium sp. IMCC21224]
MLRKTGLYSVLVLASLTAPLHAEEHYVVMLGEGYFPSTVYVLPGDTVRFVNQDPIPMAATATDSTWTTGLLATNGSFVLEVVDGMQSAYDNRLLDLGGLLTVSTNSEVVDAASGLIDYVNPAPVDLGSDGKPTNTDSETVGGDIPTPTN